MKGQEFGATQRLEREYESTIMKLLGKALPKQAKDESLSDYLQRLKDLSQKEDIQDASSWLAKNMVRTVNVKNLKSWRAAANKSQRSRMLYGLLRGEMRGATGSAVTRIVRQNANYISSLPRKVAEQLEVELLRAQQAGSRPSTIAKLMRQRFPQLLRNQVNTLSRTETQKASLALTQARCEDLNLQFYIWETSDDVRVRDSHKKMNGVIVPWSTPPSPEQLAGERAQGHYHAGGIYNCRCTQIVVLTFEDISFPARVYWKGTIRMMTRVQFQRIATGLEERRAA